jgi:hypothetical protein
VLWALPAHACCAPGCFSTAATLPSVMESPMAGTTTSPAAAVLVWIHLAAIGSSCCRPVGCNCCVLEKGCVHLRAGHRGCWAHQPGACRHPQLMPGLTWTSWHGFVGRSLREQGTNVSSGKQQSSTQTAPGGPRQLTKGHHKLPKRGLCAGAGLQEAQGDSWVSFLC